MNAAVFAVFALNVVVIAALPRVFFKKGGRFNLMWWLSADACLGSRTAQRHAVGAWRAMPLH